MKVRVTVTLDVNTDAWASEFDVDKTAVREDVQMYFTHLAYEQLNDMGLAAAVPQANPLPSVTKQEQS